MNSDQIVIKRHNAYSLPDAFFVWMGNTPLAGPMLENAANQSAIAIKVAFKKAYDRGRIDREREIYGLKDKEGAPTHCPYCNASLS